MADFKIFTSIRYDPILLEAPQHATLNTTGWNRSTASPWYMLDYHRDRMLRAANHFGWAAVTEKLEGLQGLQTLEDFLEPFSKTAGLTSHRVRVLVNKAGELSYESSPVPQKTLSSLLPSHLPAPTETQDKPSTGNTPLKQPQYEILVDSGFTLPNEFTHFKTTRREMYDAARNRYQLALADLKEVLLVNSEDGSIMEGSFTTPYFWRNGRWVTPPVSQEFNKGGQDSGGNDGTSRRWALERYVPWLEYHI